MDCICDTSATISQSHRWPERVARFSAAFWFGILAVRGDVVMKTLDLTRPGFSFYQSSLREARQKDEAVHSRYGPVVLTHAEVTRLLRHPGLVHDPRRQLMLAGVSDEQVERWFSSLLIFARAQDHRQLRDRIAATLSGPLFDSRFIAECTCAVAHRLDEGSCDFMASVANPIVDRIAAALCGLSIEAYRPVAQSVRDMALIHRLDLIPVIDQARQAVEQVQDCFGRVVRAGGSLDELALRALMSLIIGLAPLRLSIGTAIVALAHSQDAWLRLRAEPEFAAQMADEILRWMPSAPVQVRFAQCPIEWRHGRLQPGDPVLLCAAQANRDGEPDGDRFDPSRRPTRPHLTFGGGAHYCVAAMASRHLLAAVLRALASVLERPEVIGEVVWEMPSGVHGPAMLPVRLEHRPTQTVLRPEGLAAAPARWFQTAPSSAPC
jgi:cytochrome P450